jgi:hypothetical protein
MDASGTVNSKLPTYQLRYKEDYSTTVQIIIYDAFGNAIQRIDLYEAFPTSLREVRLAWGDSEQLLKLNIGISYTDFTMVGSTVENQFNAIEQTNSLGNIINKVRAERDQ